jgi:hypothetical protein
MTLAQEITDAVCLAALRGWCGWSPDADLSEVQTKPETMAAWRRAIAAAMDELEKH